ncbi:MAG: hypothetical protein HZT40_07705 [Candidatus Thiothrix singaporensis]|uniref:Uncharacterized protein n=1 Tax=Candidatus Thiothrix singaporensis TaxID=2799669 RepID=A0A7L6AQX6_9GAMM|nr:MAG: hypothetical protein HZT40_07705 [Candidatus Thiothrix singaporensis]
MNTFSKSIFAAILVLASQAAAAASWFEANGESCFNVCQAHRLNAITSGVYRVNGNPFYICRANPGREGYRAGYNLQPNWSSKCFVGYSGQEQGIESYQCLCQ